MAFSSRKSVLIFAVVAAALVTLGFLLTTNQTGRLFVVAASVLGSLIASLVIALAVEDQSGAVRDAVRRLDAGVPIVQQSHSYAVRAIKPKRFYSKDEWLRVLTEAREELLFVGHALDKWCTADIAPEFCSAIERLVTQGHPVQLLMLSESEKRVFRQREKTYATRIQKTLKTLADLHKRLPHEARRHLQVHELKPHVEMPYMVVGNERFVITSAYPATSQTSDVMPALLLESQSEIAIAVREDINALLGRYTDLIDLASYELRSETSR
jgi:hypothetical protein